MDANPPPRVCGQKGLTIKSFLPELARRFKRSEKDVSVANVDRPKNGKPRKEKAKTVLVQDGLAVLAAAGLLIFSAAARGVNLLLALGAFFLGFLIVDYFWGARTLKKLVAKRKLPDVIYAGEPFYVEIELDGTGRRSPAWSIVVEDEWEEEIPWFDVPEELVKKREADKRKERALTAGKKPQGKRVEIVRALSLRRPRRVTTPT